jgi:hypothetical protein
LAYLQERTLRILLDKLGQMQPGMPNLLVIHHQDEQARSIDLDKLMRDLRTRADGKDPSFYAASRRYDGPAAFYKDFNRLNGILLWPIEAKLWVNKQARPPLEEKIFRRVGELLSNGETQERR